MTATAAVLDFECPAPQGGTDRVSLRSWGLAGAPAVLCVHGLSRNASDFDELAALLCDDFRVLAIDMPGRGRSAWLADPARYNEGSYLAIVDHLIDRLALDAVHWVGTSMGGLLGMKFAATRGQRVRSLILNDVGPELDGRELAGLRRAAGEEASFADLAEAERYFRDRYEAFGPMSDARWRQLAEHGVQPEANGRLRPCFDTRAIATVPLPPRVGLWHVWEKVRCPALVVVGGRSRLIERGMCERMRLPDKLVECLDIPEAGHAPDLSGPARTGPLAAFIRRMEAAARSAGDKP